MVMPSPFVYWAQTENVVNLKIDLKNVFEPDLKILENSVRFAAEGVGAHGQCHYEFYLDLYSTVKTGETEDSVPIILKVFEDRVELVLKKQKSSWWPRVTAQPQKPAWLKINFDLWKSEDGLDSEEEGERPRDIMKDYPGIYDKLHKEEKGYRKEDFKKAYLMFYNVFQFIGYAFVMSVLCVRYMKFGNGALPDTYELVGAPMKFLQLLQYLEVMHPLFGYTKGSAMIPFFQVSGRAFVLFAMIEAEPRMQTKPVVFCLFVIWSFIEVIRYPFYLSQLYELDIYILKWLRYTMWIPLYPLGVLCESIIILRNIPYFEETQRFTVGLPNEWNFSFHLPTFLRIYLLFLTCPGIFFIMKHMHKLRTVKLKPKVVIKKSK